MRPPTKSRLPRRGGVLVMREPRWLGISLAVCALGPTAVLAGISLRLYGSGRTGTPGLVIAGLATLAAFGVSLHQLVGAFLKRFVVDEFGLERVGVFTRRRLRWGEVAGVAYNPVNRWFFITLADGSHLWVPVDTHGIGDFAEIALSRISSSALAHDPLARDALRDLMRSEQSR